MAGDLAVLDSDHCVQLLSVLKSFNAPINEEQCWALAYEAAKELIKCSKQSPSALYVLNGPCDLYIHTDGHVHPKTFTKSSPRRCQSPLDQILSSIGTTLFLALDYGIDLQEERSLDPCLDHLIDLLTFPCVSEDQHDVEKKTENDTKSQPVSSYSEHNLNPFSEDEHHSLIDQVLLLCTQRLNTTNEHADIYYKSVCRALVAEAMELSLFLHKISLVTAELNNNTTSFDGQDGHSDFDLFSGSKAKSSLAVYNLLAGLQDWARHWMQVIRELRAGFLLRKLDLTI